MHWVPCAFNLARLNAGKSMAARMAMMAMTTNSSISVNAPRRWCGFLEEWNRGDGTLGINSIQKTIPALRQKTCVVENSLLADQFNIGGAGKSTLSVPPAP